ncbi:TPA: hypothetical protein DEG75_01635 [Candidatus Dependentiae bacterium]|nr:hypothetical protein [Candidatus Dependentiae bacterium]
MYCDRLKMFSFKKFLKKFFIVVLCSILLGAIIIGIISFVVMRKAKTETQQNGSICCVAGKSGGHLIPALTLARRYREEHPNAHVLFFSTDTPLDKNIVQKAGFVNEHITFALGNVPRWDFWNWPKYFWNLSKVSWYAWRALLKARPEKVMTTGGFISLPIGIISRTLGIPIYLYELNAVPGKAATVLSIFATKTFVCFDEAFSKFPRSARVIRGTYPLRFDANDRLTKEEARVRLGIENADRVMLVIGGSQGSFFINTIMPEVIAGLALSKKIMVMHQTGESDVTRVRDLYRERGIQALVFAYREDMAVLYSAADCVISRAGAGSLFELLFFEKPSIIVPLETLITDHQLDNAQAMAEQYPAFFSVFRQADLERSTQGFARKLSTLLS